MWEQWLLFIPGQLADGTVVANGNADPFWRLANGSRDMFLFSPSTELWTSAQPLLNSATLGAGVFLPSINKLLATGASSSNEISAELYTPPA